MCAYKERGERDGRKSDIEVSGWDYNSVDRRKVQGGDFVVFAEREFTFLRITAKAFEDDAEDADATASGDGE